MFQTQTRGHLQHAQSDPLSAKPQGGLFGTPNSEPWMRTDPLEHRLRKVEFNGHFH